MKKEEGKENSFGIASVILGILSVLSASAPGIIMGIVGLVFSIRQKKVGKNKWSKAGTILNIVGIVVGIISVIFLVNYVSNLAQFQGGF